jgi:hypothetical protein
MLTLNSLDNMLRFGFTPRGAAPTPPPVTANIPAHLHFLVQVGMAPRLGM